MKIKSSISNLTLCGKKTVIRVISICFTAVLATVFYTAFFRNDLGYASLAYQELDAKKRLVNIKKENRDNYESNLANLEILEQDLDILNAKIVPYIQVSTAIEYVSDIMSRCRINETHFYSGGYEEIPVTGLNESERLFIISAYLSGTGRYPDILTFIDSLNESDILYIIESVELSAEKGTDLLSISVQFYFYAFQTSNLDIQTDFPATVNKSPFMPDIDKH